MIWTHESYHRSVNYGRLGECSPEKDCLWWPWLTFRQPEQTSLSKSRCYKSLVVVLIVDDLTTLLVACQLSHDVIGCEDCKMWLVHFDPSFVSQMSVGLLLVKLVGLSYVILSCYCHQQVIWKVQVAVSNSSVVFVLSYSALKNQLSRVIHW